jgi:hypothetical protein
MKQVIYAMQFKGKAGPGPSANVMKASTSGSSNTLTTVVGAEGVQGKIEPAAGGKAEFESEVTLIGDTSFLEKGTIRFGGAHRLRFSDGRAWVSRRQQPTRPQVGDRDVARRWWRGAIRGRQRIYHVELYPERCGRRDR